MYRLIRYQSSSESSYSQKLIVEHTRYQDLQQRHQRMEEDYENQLKAAAEGRIQSLEELKQAYESRLEEKSQHLTEVVQEEKFPLNHQRSTFDSSLCAVSGGIPAPQPLVQPGHQGTGGGGGAKDPQHRNRVPAQTARRETDQQEPEGRS